MELPLAEPGQVIDAWSTWTDAEVKAVVLRTNHMEVMRLHLNPGIRIPTYEAQGEIIIFCIQGRVEVAAAEMQRELNGGQLLYLLVGEPFEMHGLEESSLLITILRNPERTLIGEGGATAAKP
jgi:quercetin dioxygenase-like cupin family protein